MKWTKILKSIGLRDNNAVYYDKENEEQVRLVN